MPAKRQERLKNPANRRGERHVAVVARHNFGMVADGDSARPRSVCGPTNSSDGAQLPMNPDAGHAPPASLPASGAGGW